MMESKDIISTIRLNLINDDGILVSFIGQSNTFRLSIKEAYYFINAKNINRPKITF